MSPGKQVQHGPADGPTALQRGVRPAHMGSSSRTSHAGSRPTVMYSRVSSIRWPR